MSGSTLGAGSQRGMEMTSNAGNTVGLGAREGSNPFCLGNQEAPQRKRHSSGVLKNRRVRGAKLAPGHSRNQPKERPGGDRRWCWRGSRRGGEGPSPKASGALAGAVDAHARTYTHNTHTLYIQHSVHWGMAGLSSLSRWGAQTRVFLQGEQQVQRTLPSPHAEVEVTGRQETWRLRFL